jgi:uncharacterized protein (DUF302 family)
MERRTQMQSPTNSDLSTRRQGNVSRIIYFVSGLVIGSVLVGIIVWLSMPSMMIVVHQSRYDSIDETCNRLKAAIEANGWESPAIRNMNNSMAKQGIHMDKQVRIVELCNAKYAKDVLMTNPEVSTLMPCAWGVYEGKDGKIYLSGMNMGLMGKMFGGNIAKVMGGAVSKDEEKILKDVIRE